MNKLLIIKVYDSNDMQFKIFCREFIEISNLQMILASMLEEIDYIINERDSDFFIRIINENSIITVNYLQLIQAGFEQILEEK